MPRPDPDRHHATTATAPGRGSGRRPSTSRRSSPRSGSSRALECGGPGATAVVVRIAGKDRDPRRAAAPRPPGRRAGAGARTGRVDPFAGEIARTAYRCLGPRRGRHEGHGRDDAGGGPRRGPRRGRSPSATSCWLPRRRGGRRRHGSHWLVDNRPDLFEGVTEAVGEVGGFSHDGPGRPAALPDRDRGEGHGLDAADRDAGGPGHGSMINDDNAVTALCEAVARIGRHEWPVR